MKLQSIPTAATFLAVAASTAWWWLTSPPALTNALPARMLGVPTAVNSTSEGLPGYHWQAGASAVYKLETAVAIAPTGTAPETGSGLLLHGRLHLRVLTVTADTVEVGAILSGITALRAKQPETELAVMMESTPCLLRLHPDGRVQEVRMAPDVPEADRELIRLGCAWEFCLRPQPRWSAEENNVDLPGFFRAVYRRMTDGTVKKGRSFVSHERESARQRVLLSSFTGRPGTVWLDALEGQESTELLMGGEPVALSLVHVRLTRTEDSPPPPLLARAFPADTILREATFTLKPGASPRESVNSRLERRALAARYGGMAAGEILAIAGGVEGKSMQDKLPALHAARDWLLVHGESEAAQLLEALRNGVPQETSGLLVHALGLANSQVALATVLEAPDQQPPAVLMQAIVEAGGASTADSRIIEALRQLTGMEMISAGEEDFYPSDAAWYSLGRLAEKDPALRMELEHTLAPALPEADGAMRAVALRTLANARTTDMDVLTFAASCARDAAMDADIRLASVDVLARTPVLPSGGIMGLNDLLQNGNTEMQLAALEALQIQRPAWNSDSIALMQSLVETGIESVASAARLALDAN